MFTIKEDLSEMIPLETGSGSIITQVNRNWDDAKIIEKYVEKVGLQKGYRVNITRVPTRVVVIPVHRERFVKQLMSNLDPHAIIDHNNLYRRYNTTGDLYNYHEMIELKLSNKYNRISTHKSNSSYAYSGMNNTAQGITYMSRNSRQLSDHIRIINRIYKHINICIAGGFATSCLFQRSPETSDIDIFFYRCSDRDNNDADRDDISSIIKTLIVMTRESNVCHVRIMNGLINIFTDDSIIIQFIIRVYPSISALLHSFDIGSCCVAFDGSQIYITAFGMYSLTHRVNIVVPSYASKSYFRRLMKYKHRGFSIVFPEFKLQYISNDIITMSGQQYQISNRDRHVFQIDDVPINHDGDDDDCDYGSSQFREEFYSQYGRDYYLHLDNLRALTRSMQYSAVESNEATMLEFISIMFGLPKISSFVDFDEIVKIGKVRMIRNDETRTLNTKLLVNTFNLTSDQLTQCVCKYYVKNSYRDLAKYIDTIIDKLRDKFDREKNNVFNIVLEFDPAMKVSTGIFSSTINKTPMTYEEFYSTR